MKRIYIKTEPAGEVSLGEVPTDKVEDLLKAVKENNQEDIDDFLDTAWEYDNLYHSFGAFCWHNPDNTGIIDKDNNTPIMNLRTEVTLDQPDGVYCLSTSLSKGSIDFELPCTEKEFNAKKLEITYSVIDACLFENLYGEIEYGIIESFMYDGEEIEEPELVDRGNDLYAVYFELKDGEIEILLETPTN